MNSIKFSKNDGALVFSDGHPAYYFVRDIPVDYFKVQSMEHLWTGFGMDVMVPCYRRPLEYISNVLYPYR